MRPVGPDDRIHTPRKSNVGDGQKPSADVRILKYQDGSASTQASSGSRKHPPAMPARQISSSVPIVLSSVPAFSEISSSVPLGFMHAKGTELASSLGLPADRSAFLALAAMLGELLALTPQSAMSIRRLVKLNNDDPVAARLAARAIAVGLDPDSDLVGRVIESIADSDNEPQDFEGGSNGLGDHKQESDSGFQGFVDPYLEVQAIHTLSEVLENCAMDAALNGDFASLTSPGPNGGGWVCIPFKVPYNGVDFAGIMRVWYDTGAVRAGRLVADIRSGGQRRLLDVREEAIGRVLRYHADDIKERIAFSEAFSGFGKVITGDLESGDLEELQQSLKVERDA